MKSKNMKDLSKEELIAYVNEGLIIPKEMRLKNIINSKDACVSCGKVGDKVTDWHRKLEKDNFHMCTECRRSRSVE